MTAATWVQSRLHTSTLSALSHASFRLYFAGQLVSVSGTWMQIVAQGWLVFYLTKSELWLGIVACAAGLPSLLLSSFAGVMVDRLPRRRILIITQTTQMCLALILSALTFANTVQVWHVVVLAFLLGVVNSIDAPARQAFITDMVGHDDLSSGITLNSIVMNASRVVGPAAAGIALAQVGPGWCFLLNGLSFLAVIATLIVMDVQATAGTRVLTSPLAQLKEGLRFSKNHPTIGPLLLLATVASVFILNIGTLLPAFADVVLHSPVDAYAAMNTAQGVGAVTAGLLVAWMGRRFGRGQIVTWMAVFSPVMIVLVAQMTAPLPAVFLMSAVGFGLILQFITVNTMIQSEVPDEFRGRVMSLYTLSFFGMAPFGALLLGYIAGLIGPVSALSLYAAMGGAMMVVIMWRASEARHLR